MPWKKGESGNPQGRKRGQRNKATLLREQFETDGPAVARKLAQMAKKGDLDAMKFLLSRLLPPARELPEPMPAIKGRTLSEIGQEVVEASLRGEITPARAKEITSALSSVAGTKQIDDMEERLERLERRYENPASKT